jgi:lysozyme
MKGKVAAGGLLALVLAISAWFVGPWEGSEPVGYRDIVGVATACTGHTGPGVVVGKRYTPEQCRAWFESDLGVAATGVDACIAPPMKSYQWAAFTSLAFNIGVARFCRSTIARLANAGDWQGACKAIGLYVYAGGRKVQGLINRRGAEIALCEGRT